MSVRVMTKVWGMDLPDSQKIVLLALADCANDEGHCWPSMRTLATKCSKSERTVQGVIIKLVEAGHLTRREVPGKGCNYTVHPRNDCTPAETAPPQGATQTPAEIAGHPRSGCGQTVREPSKNRKRRAPSRAAQRPDDISEGVWADFIDQRKKKFTQTALDGFRKQAEKAGWPIEEAMAHAAMRGWEGFDPSWVEKRDVANSGGPKQTPQEWLAFCEERVRAARRAGNKSIVEEWEAKEREARARLPQLQVVK